jgi:hypothetical protein
LIGFLLKGRTLRRLPVPHEDFAAYEELFLTELKRQAALDPELDKPLPGVLVLLLKYVAKIQALEVRLIELERRVT